MPRFDGSRPGPGRPKGALSPWSKRALKQVEAVFLRLGGIDHMVAWAQDSPSDFYRVWSRLLPSQHSIDARHQHSVDPAQMSDADLLRVIAMATQPAVLDWAADQAKDAIALEPDAVPAPDQDRTRTDPPGGGGGTSRPGAGV